MLDEPSLGLAPIIVADIFRTIGELRAAQVQSSRRASALCAYGLEQEIT
jgi:hypothetical protein